jgi:hypothetical protein
MSIAIRVVAKFDVGDVRMTRGAADKLHQEDVFEAFVRHLDGDWGNLCEEDWDENQNALEIGTRLLSSYVDRNDNKFWIITEADRSATTVLLPCEY